MTATTTPATRATPSRSVDVEPRSTLSLARSPWQLETAHGPVRVRGAVPADLRQLAMLHSRCSAGTLLQRYLRGGAAPSLAVLSHLLSQPLTLVAQAGDGRLVALASGGRPTVLADAPRLPGRALQLGVVVEDAWQRGGIGRALAGHLAACALLLGYRTLVADVAAQGLPLRRILDGIGETRSARHPAGSRLRTRLDVSVVSALGTLGVPAAG